MDATHDSHDSATFWTFGNIILTLGFGLFAGVSAGALLYQALFAPLPAAAEATAAPSTSTTPAPAAAPVTAAPATAIPATAGATQPASAPATSTTAKAPATTASAQAPAAGDVQTVMIKTSPSNPLAYDTTSVTVKAGKSIRLTFDNNSIIPQPHNFILCKPGTKEKIVALAAAMLTSDPNAFAKGFIPESPDIIAHTRLLNAKESQSIDFAAPPPGDYPFFCSFPGHSLTMSGVLKVQ